MKVYWEFPLSLLLMGKSSERRRRLQSIFFDLTDNEPNIPILVETNKPVPRSALWAIPKGCGQFGHPSETRGFAQIHSSFRKEQRHKGATKTSFSKPFLNCCLNRVRTRQAIERRKQVWVLRKGWAGLGQTGESRPYQRGTHCSTLAQCSAITAWSLLIF